MRAEHGAYEPSTVVQISPTTAVLVKDGTFTAAVDAGSLVGVLLVIPPELQIIVDDTELAVSVVSHKNPSISGQELPSSLHVPNSKV